MDLRQHFQTLEIKPGASLEEVRKAYRDQSLIWHPDRFPSNNPRLQKKAEDKMKEINEAYDILKPHLSKATESESRGRAEEEDRRTAEEKARKRAEEEKRAKKTAEEEALRMAEEEYYKAEAERKYHRAKEEKRAKKRAEEEARKRAEVESEIRTIIKSYKTDEEQRL